MTRPVAALISCVSQKKDTAGPAKDFYVSPLFQKSKTFAESLGLEVWILSAKYGLIKGNVLVSPYETTLNRMSKSQIEQWAVWVGSQVSNEFGEKTLLVLAGEKYLRFSCYCLNPIINPLKGKPIGKRLQWLTQHQH